MPNIDDIAYTLVTESSSNMHLPENTNPEGQKKKSAYIWESMYCQLKIAHASRSYGTVVIVDWVGCVSRSVLHPCIANWLEHLQELF